MFCSGGDPTVISHLPSLRLFRPEQFRRGGSRIFFRRGCTRLLLYFKTNKPHSFFVFLQNTSCIRKPQVISGMGAHPLHPPPRSAPVPDPDLEIRGGGELSSRPLDKGGGDRSPKTFFSALLASVWS